jgi:hypothetical protein
VNVLHAACPAAPTSAQIEAIAEAVDSTVGAHLNVWGDQMHYDGTRVTDLNSVSGPQVLEPDNAGPGTGGNNAPAGVCCLVKLTTATRGRSERGRIFISACPTSDLINDGTAWDPAYLTVVNNAFIAMATALQALPSASDLVVASRKLGTSTNVTTIGAEAAPAYQRRRGGR